MISAASLAPIPGIGMIAFRPSLLSGLRLTLEAEQHLQIRLRAPYHPLQGRLRRRGLYPQLT
jgi:hypothetical protein